MKYFYYKSSIIFGIIALLCSTEVMIAQHYNCVLQKYTTADGLPHDDICSFYKDSKGYLWIGTRNGIVKYDGTTFMPLKVQINNKSVKGHWVSAIIEDKKGTIWFAYNGLVGYNRNNNTFTYLQEDKSNPKALQCTEIYHLFNGDDSTIWLLTRTGLQKFNIYNLEFLDYPFPPDKVVTLNSNFINYSLNKNKLYYNLLYYYIYEFDTEKGISKFIFDALQKYQIGTLRFINDTMYGICLERKGKCIDAILKKFYLSYDSIYPIDTFFCQQPQLFYDNKYIYSFYKNEIRFYNLKGKKIKTVIYKREHETDLTNNPYLSPIMCFYNDHDEVFWIGTKDGLYKIRNQKKFCEIADRQCLMYPHIRSLYVDSYNTLWIATNYQNALYFIKNCNSQLTQSQIKMDSIVFKDRTLINYMQQFDDKLICCGYNLLLSIDIKEKRVVNLLRINTPNFRCLSDYGKKIWVGSITEPNLFICKTYKPSFIIDTVIKKIHESNGISAIYLDKENQLWIGGEGLFKVHINSQNQLAFEQQMPFKDQNGNSMPIWNIIDFGKDYLLIGTSESGLYLFNKRTKNYFPVNFPNNKICNVTSGIVLDKNNNYWISTLDGLYFFDTKNFKSKRFLIEDGLISNDFNFKSFAQSADGWIFFGTKKGVVYFHPDSLKDNCYPTPLRIQHFYVLDSCISSEIDDGDTIVLQHDQNFFNLHFSQQDFRNPQKLIYQYRLNSFDKAHKITTGKNAQASYTNVPPGTYTFNLKVVNSICDNQDKELSITIIVIPAFYQTWYFKLSIVVFAISIFLFFIFLNVRRRLLKEKLTKVELDLLRNQINPHFIFNTVASIQSMILKNDPLTAVDYVGKFGVLLRKGLEYTTIEYVTIEEVISFIKDYIKLMSMNLIEPIRCNIIIDPQIEVNKTDIPPMILQPFIENAIIHGLIPKKMNMNIDIHFTKEEDYILCDITDNGIGRKKQQSTENKNKRKSLGLEITKKRLMALMEKSSLKKDCIRFQDLFDNDENALGTKVLIKLPFQINLI